MNTTELLIQRATEVHQALEKLQTGLAKDGVAIDGFVDAWNASVKFIDAKLNYQFDNTVLLKAAEDYYSHMNSSLPRNPNTTFMLKENLGEAIRNAKKEVV